MPPWKPLLLLTTAAVQHTDHRSPDTKLLVVGIYGLLLLLLRGSMLGRVVRWGVFGADVPGPLGGMLTPVLASLLRCLHISENRGVYHSQASRPGHSWQARKRYPLSLSSWPARRETPIPQQQELHSWRPWLSSLATPPFLHPSLFSSAPLSPCCPPPKILSGIPEQKGHMELLLWSRSMCHHWHQFRGKIHTGTFLHCWTSSVCEVLCIPGVILG